MKLAWPWRLHRELAQRQLRGEELDAEADAVVAQSAGQLEAMRRTAKPLTDKAGRNQFAQLIADCVDGLAFRRDGARFHGS